MAKQFIEEFIVVRIKEIDYVKVLFKEDFPNHWNGVQAQNHIIEVLKILFKNYEVELHSRYKEEK